MAARRLLIVMLVLLGISTLAAAFLPAPEREAATTAEEEPRARGAEPEAAAAEATGRVVDARFLVPPPRRQVVGLRPGDRLRLDVSGNAGDDILIPAFGLTETMTPDATARFDLVIDRPGVFAVTRFAGGAVVGLIRACPRKGLGGSGGGGSAGGGGDVGAPVPGCEPLVTPR